MSDIREMLQQVFAEDDRLRADFERWEWKQRQVKQRSADLIYKTHEPKQQTAAMTPDVERAWNDWWSARFKEAISRFANDYTTMMGQAVGEAEKEIRRDMIAEMEKRIAAVKFPTIKGWVPRMYAEGEIVIAGGGTYQAQRDTHQRPGHSDWACLACPGADGEDGRDVNRGVIDLPDWRKGKRNVA
jgi:hypothetical protein